MNSENRENKNAQATELTNTNHLAMEVLKNEMNRSKAKDIGLLAVAVLAALILIAGAVTNIHLADVNQKNNRDWINLFGSYDYVSQDGEGINNINTGSQGDLNNGPVGKE